MFPDDVKGLFRRSIVYEHIAVEVLTTKADKKEFWDPEKVRDTLARAECVPFAAQLKGPAFAAQALWFPSSVTHALPPLHVRRRDLTRALVLLPEDPSFLKSLHRIQQIEVRSHCYVRIIA